MSNNNKAKGSKYEKELADLLTGMGFPAQRIPLSGAAGGMFSDDILVEFAPGLTAKLESKYRSKPERYGVGKKLLELLLELKARHPDDPVCVRVGSFHVRELTEFPSLPSTPRVWAYLPKPTAELASWMAQASTAGLPVVCIRLPHRVWRFPNKWLVVTDASSENHLRLLNSTASQMRSAGLVTAPKSTSTPGSGSGPPGSSSPAAPSRSRSAPTRTSTGSKRARSSRSTAS